MVLQLPPKAGVRLPLIFQLPLLVSVSTAQRLHLLGEHQEKLQGFGLPGMKALQWQDTCTSEVVLFSA